MQSNDMAKGMSLDGFLAPFFVLSFRMCGQFQEARLHFVQRRLGSDSSASGSAAGKGTVSTGSQICYDACRGLT